MSGQCDGRCRRFGWRLGPIRGTEAVSPESSTGDRRLPVPQRGSSGIDSPEGRFEPALGGDTFDGVNDHDIGTRLTSTASSIGFPASPARETAEERMKNRYLPPQQVRVC